MPQFLVANVIFAARLQSLDFVKNYVAKVQNFPELAKLFSNYFSKKCEIGAVFHFFSFSLLTSAFSQIVNRETLLLYIIYNI